MIQDLGVKRDFFVVVAKSVSYETTPDWLLPSNFILVCQLAERRFSAAFNLAGPKYNPLSAADLQLCPAFSHFFLISF